MHIREHTQTHPSLLRGVVLFKKKKKRKEKEETFTYVSVKEEKRALDVFNEERMLWDLKIYTFDI